MKFLALCVTLTPVLFATSAFAQKSTIQGNAADDKGRPLPNAQVRIQSEKSKAAPTMVKTDSKGHFVATGLPAGTYTVAVLVGNETKWSAAHVKTQPNQVVTLSLGKELGVQTAAANAPKKRAVWVPSGTGSHLGGHYEDEPYRGPKDQNVDGLSGEALRRMQTQRQGSPGY
jgi:hypothetical protein